HAAALPELWAYGAHNVAAAGKRQMTRALSIRANQIGFPPSERFPQGGQSDRIGPDLRAHASQTQGLEGDRRQLGQEARPQQFRLEDAHAPTVLGVAVLKETPEIESVQKHADLGGSEVLAVVHLLAAASQAGHAAQRANVVVQADQWRNRA